MRLVPSAALAAAALVTLAGCSHDKKDDRGNGRTAPSAAAVIPSSFRNTVDEAGFRQKLPQSASLLEESAAGFKLYNPGAGHSGRRAGLAPALLAHVAGRLAVPAPAVRAMTGAFATGSVSGSEASDGDVEGSLDQVQALQVGSDCTQLATSLSGSFDEALQDYSRAVEALARTDFSTAKGFSKDTPDTATEAFAYRIQLSNADLQQSGALDEDGSDVQMAFGGRFAGGADERSVALKANGKLTLQAQQASGDILTDLDTYADVPAKQLAMGLGFDLALAGKNERGQPEAVGARFAFDTKLTGGDRPGETMHVTGSATNGKETRAADVSVSLTRADAKTMVLAISGNVQGKALAETVSMALGKDQFDYDTCKVASITH